MNLGTIVTLKPSSDWAGFGKNNPVGVTGTVVKLYPDATDGLTIEVQWDAPDTVPNQYGEEDLEVQA